MKRRLFLTGPIGCGKSTAIAGAIGERLPGFGGFLTRRTRDAAGHAVSFALVSPDGRVEETFLDVSSGKPEIRMEVFETWGVSLLQGDVLVLDEIGGIELLCPAFVEALEALLRSKIPVIGVMKGEAPAAALIRALGLTGEYELAAQRLRTCLRQDADTLLYECGQFDKTALLLAAAWVKEYVHDELF